MEKVVLWGTGIIARRVSMQRTLFDDYHILGYIDSDRHKVGTYFFGKEVFSPEYLLSNNVDRIVVLTNQYENICTQIREIGIKNIPIENKYFFYEKEILKRYQNSCDQEIQKKIAYIKEKGLSIFNDSFVNKYQNMNIDVCFDDLSGLFYVIYKDKKMFFSRKYDTEEKVRRYYRSILIEQDAESPHKYLSDCFVSKGKIIVDVGAAEGNFSLDLIESAEHIYIIEADPDWIEALSKTFQNYSERVTIINKFVSSLDGNGSVRLDTIIQDTVDYIKMDIEGYEWDALQGAEQIILNSPNLECAICVYHHDFDEELIGAQLRRFGLKCSTSEGYMWFDGLGRKSYVSTKFVRGILRGHK